MNCERLKLLLISLVLFILAPSMVFAENKVTLGVDKTDLTIGDIVTISANVTSDEEKLYALIATLSYDHNVFEEIDISDFGLESESMNINYNNYTNKFGIINKSGAIPSNLFTLKLRVKNDANVGTTNIGLTNITASAGDNKTSYDKSSLELLITKDASSGDVVNNNKPYEVEDNKETEIKVFTNKPIVISLGVVSITLIILTILVCIFRKESVILRNTLIVLAIITLGGFIFLNIINYNKKDVNDDGVKNYNDAKDIMEYLLDFEGKEDNNQVENNQNNSNKNNNNSNNKNNNNNSHQNETKPDKDYDVNNDGKVDIDDVASSTGDTTEKTNYKVTLDKIANDGKYLAKGNEIALDFTATVSPSEDIIGVVINDTYYEVIKSDSYYRVLIDTTKLVGTYEFKFTEVKLSNNRDVKTKLTLTKEILKEIPYVDMFNVDDENNILSFNLEDPEKAFISGKFAIYENDDVLIKEQDLKNVNTFEYEFDIDKFYTIYIYATYDLDSDLENGENSVTEKEIYKHNFSVAHDYDFQINNVTITDAIEKGQNLTISFESMNRLNFDVDYIVINGIEYDVTLKNDNYYEVLIDKLDTSKIGKYYLNIDQVVLDNFKGFTLHNDYEINDLMYNVLKQGAIVNDINITDNKDSKELAVNYNLEDQDTTLLNLDAVLVDSTDKVVDTLEGINPNESIKLSYDGNNDGRYKVKFLADLDLGTERHIYQDKNIGEKEVLTQKEVSIIKAEVKKLFPTKGEAQYTITFQVSVSDAIKSKYSELAGVTINGLNYDGAKDNNYVSKVSFKVPDESGILTLKIDRVKLRHETYNGISQEYFSVEPYIIQIDVLKDIPTIENFTVKEEDYNKGEATFNFDVKTDKGGFNGGYVTLGNARKDIVEGNNEVTFTDISKDQELELKFYASYDLDTNILDKENKENNYTDEMIHTIKYGLYNGDVYDNIKITNLNAVSISANNYFEKNEEVKLYFDALGLEELKLNIEKVVINHEEYNVSYDNNYSLIIKGFNTTGEKEIVIDKIYLSNGKVITLKDKVATKIEILKDEVKMADFNYTVNNNNIKMTFKLKDLDLASNMNDIVVKIFREDNTLYQEIPFANELSFEVEEGNPRYYVKVYATYDRDISKGDSNYFQNILILDKTVSTAKNYVEFKEIEDVNLYLEDNNKVNKVEEIDIKSLEANKDKYFVEIILKDMPTVYAKIDEIVIKDNKVILILDYHYVILNNKKYDRLEIELGTINDDKVTNDIHPDTLEELLNKIKENPKGNYTLERDYDAEGLNFDNYLIDVPFSGTLNGNNHQISNLKAPLFNTIEEGTVENLILVGAQLTSSDYKGLLANTVNKATIRNILVDGVQKDNSPGQAGTLIGIANNSNIEKVRVKGFELNVSGNNQQNGGLIGVLSNSTLKNSYAIGNIRAAWNYMGGLVGNASNSEISNCYAKVVFSGGTVNAVSYGLAGSVNGGLRLKNNIAISNANNPFAGNIKESNNNYAVSSKDNVITGLSYVNKEDITKDLFIKTEFDEEIWYLNKASYDNMPVFNSEKETSINKEEEYDETKEILYRNLMLLMPYYNSKQIIEASKLIADDNILVKEEILHIVPIGSDGNIVTYLTDNDVSKIQKLKVVFKNKEKITYDIRFDHTYNNIAHYRIPSLKIDYTYNHYIIDTNSRLVNNLTNYLRSLTYSDNLDKLTSTPDSRIYRDFYNDTTKNELQEFVLKYLSNSNYTNTIHNETIDDYLEKEIKNNNNLDKMLYTYNYFRRFYDVSIDGIKLNDLVLFGLSGFNDNMNLENITKEFLSNADNMKTGSTNDTYKRLFYKYTNLENITDFLEYLVNEFSNENIDNWFANSFKGYIREVNIDDRSDITYTLWSHISNVDVNTQVSWFNYALPILTLPKDAAYIISSPGQFIIGAERTYIANPADQASQLEFRKRVDKYADIMKEYYTITSRLVEESIYFNNIHTIEIDKRYTYDDNGILTFQNPYSTEEDFHKNFNEVIGQWAYNDYNAATANGAYIIWRVEGVLDGEWTYNTWSHETAHNMDARLFLKNNGRRFDAGGEDYADSNLTQSFGEGDITMNLSKHYDKNSYIGSNLQPSRIDSPAKIEDFYKKVFQTIYIMDYLEGEAFLKLTPLEQSKIAVQASYPRENEGLDPSMSYLYHQHTVYQEIDESKFIDMHLNSIEDLYNNRLVIFPGVIYSTYTTNRYGGEGIYKVRWYQPHNDEGRPDSYSIKWLAYEMLGYKGYKDGYIEYYSNINSIKKEVGVIENNQLKMKEVDYKTDLMALKTITGISDITFKKYKEMRFKEVENNLESIQYIDVNEMFNKFYEALKKDAEIVRLKQEEAYKLYPGNTKEDQDKRNKLINDSKVKYFANSTAVRKEIYYTIKNGTNDFEGLVYDSNNKHAVKPFEIN